MGRGRRGHVLGIAVLFVSRIAVGAQVGTPELEKACMATTRVYETVNGTPEAVGEQIDGLCRGYLEASLDIAITSGQVCLSEPRPSSEYLASVFLTYLAKNPGARKDAALLASFSALMRAFPCKTPPPAEGAPLRQANPPKER